ncbi:MAG TPA: NAD-dependent epimerase/dehydratase family protein [Sediminibacterium sp.]
MKQKVLITGVGGFIGSHIAKRFVEEGYTVVGVDDLSMGRKENIPEGIEFLQKDLSVADNVAAFPQDCTLILHLAGQSSGEISYDDPVADLEKNVVSTLNLIQYGIRNQVERIVYASSMSVYGNVPDEPVKEHVFLKPLSVYGVGKFASEGYLRVYQAKLPFVAMRMFNVYGPGQDLSNLRQGMVSIYLAQALATGRICVKGSLNRYRDFIYIDDVVESWFRAATEASALNRIFNIGTGQKTTVGELLKQICDNIPGSEFYVEGSTPGDQNGIYANTENLQEIVDVSSFTSLGKGLTTFISWAKSNINK